MSCAFGLRGDSAQYPALSFEGVREAGLAFNKLLLCSHFKLEWQVPQVVNLILSELFGICC